MDFLDALHISSYETFLKLMIAAFLSLIIGLERELKRKPVGLKTSVVIATFSCLLTIISIETAYLAKGSTHDGVNITMDPLRLAAQIVSGIGFLGAGVILKRGNDSISGLTTAAMIWGAGGIGIAVAAGFYIEAFFAVAIILFGIEALPPLLFKFGPKRLRMVEASIKIIVSDTESFPIIAEAIESNEVSIESLSIFHHEGDSGNVLHQMAMRVSYYHTKETISLYQEIMAIDKVEEVDIELIN